MKQVYQEDDFGCWMACAAMLTGVSYAEIKKRFKFRGEVTGRSAAPLVKLLDELGFSCDDKSTKLSKIGALKNLQRNALVYAKNIDRDGKDDGGHWMVWDAEEQVLRDPEGWLAGSRRSLRNFRVVKHKDEKRP